VDKAREAQCLAEYWASFIHPEGVSFPAISCGRRGSALPDAGDFVKRLASHPAAMSASNFLELDPIYTNEN
jgi:hypothetical protein